jgi:hypothetical protein
MEKDKHKKWERTVKTSGGGDELSGEERRWRVETWEERLETKRGERGQGEEIKYEIKP